MNSDVKKYIEKQQNPQKTIIKKLRKIIFDTLPNIEESFKNGVPWYEGKFYLVGLRDKVNFGFSVKGLTKKEQDLFEGTGKLMRHLKIFQIKDIDKPKLAQLLKLVNKKHKVCHK